MTTDMIGIRLLGALFAATFFATVAARVVRPTPKLGSRVRPYTAASRSLLGRSPDRAALLHNEPATAHNVMQRLTRPLVESLVNTVMKIFGGAFDDETLALKLRQANVLTDIAEEDRVHEYRVRQVGAGLAWGVGGGLAGTILTGSGPIALAMFTLGAVIGVSRRTAGVGGKIEDRRERMRVELYTINQLLAIYLRTSGSPVLAAQRLVRRGRGAVIDELNEALRLHARGMSAAKAFGRISETTPEPFASRTYKLLASGSERGADLASALLSLSEDVRDYRRTAVRRTATKRQAAMLLPIIGCLAPVMLLFIAAPLPSLLLNGTR